jgi:hypothetical protein
MVCGKWHSLEVIWGINRTRAGKEFCAFAHKFIAHHSGIVGAGPSRSDGLLAGNSVMSEVNPQGDDPEGTGHEQP